MNKTVIGLFARRTDADDAADLLKAEGYNPKDISVVMKYKRMEEELAEDTGEMIAGGAISGLTAGSFLGGIAGLIGAYVLPGLGAFFVGGPIVALLGLSGVAASVVSGLATGAIAGGLIGALVALGLSVDEAQAFEQRIRAGGVLLAVAAKAGEEGKVERIFKDSDAEDIKTVIPRKFEPENAYVVDNSLLNYRGPYPAYAGVKGGRMSQKSKRGVAGKKGGRLQRMKKFPEIKGSSMWYNSDISGSASGNVIKRRGK